jgi:molybdopterin/thiamine biosynthesis adenylyltransferase
MSGMLVPGPMYALLTELALSATEECAVLFAAPSESPDARMLCHEALRPAAADYLKKSSVEAQLTPAFLAKVTKRARNEGWHLVFVHSHLEDNAPHFSATDDRGESTLRRFLEGRIPGRQCASIVISRGGLRARILGTDVELPVIVVGESRNHAFNPNTRDANINRRFDRQVRAFGRDGQQVLSSLTIGIVGLGGTGSVTAQQLAYLGVRRFVLIDPDSIEQTNLNRVVGATLSDLGRAKVDVARDMIATVSREADVLAIRGDITYLRTAKPLLAADCIFGCTDSHGSRAVLQQVAYQYLIPTIDMGCTVIASEGQVMAAIGRTQLLAPGLGCFTCGGLLDPEQVRRDMMSEYERRLDPYITGGGEPAPAVVSINSIVASYAINMFLAVFLQLPFAGRQLVIDLKKNVVRVVRTLPRADCHICSSRGALARGSLRQLAARLD